MNENQKRASKENWMLFQLKGAIGNLRQSGFFYYKSNPQVYEQIVAAITSLELASRLIKEELAIRKAFNKGMKK